MDKLLHQFRVVAELKNITAASDILHISQPALTKNIKKLEQQFDVKLFERLPRGMQLTAYGEQLLKRVGRIEMEYHYAREELNALKSGVSAKLRVGAGPIWGLAYMPHVLDRLYQEFPGLQMILKAGTTQELIPQLMNGELDLALGASSYEGQTPDELAHIPLVNVEFVVVARPSHPLAGKTRVSAAQLNACRWVVFQRATENILRLNEFFHRHNLPPADVCLQSSYWSSALELLLMGDYLMCIPCQLFGLAQQSGLVLIPQEDVIWEFSSGIWYHPTNIHLPAVSRLIEVIQDECESNQ